MNEQSKQMSRLDDEINRLKKQLNRITEEKHRFEILTDYITDWICWFNLKGEPEYVSPSCESITGYTAEEFTNDFQLFFNIIHPEERDKVRALIQALLTSPKTCSTEFRIIHKSGEIRWLLHECGPIYNKQGQIIGLRVRNRDITKEKELRKNAGKFFGIFKNISTGIVLVNEEHIIIDCNPAISKITGYDREEFIGKHIGEAIFMLLPEKEKERRSADFFKNKIENFGKRYAASSLRKEQEVVIQRKDGQLRTLLSFSFPLQAEDEHLIVNVNYDITKERQAQLALKKSEEQYKNMYNMFRLIADNNPDLLWAKDLQGRFIFTNKALCEKLLNAKDTEEPIGKTDLFFAQRERQSHPEQPDWHTFGEACINSDQATLEAQKPMRFDEFGNVKGKFLFLDVYKAPLRDEQGNIIGTVGSARDVTKEKELEKKQAEGRKELKRLATVIEQADISVIITTLDGTIQYVNPAFEKITGFTYQEAVGKNLRIIKSDKQDKKFYKNLWETITKGQVWKGEFINKRKDGSEYYEEAVIFPVKDENGHIINYAAIQRDITGKKKLEEQIFQMQKMESVGVLTGGIAHDFNNLLTVINGYSELLLNKYGKNAELSQTLQAIHKAGKRAAQLTAQLLAFSRKQIIAPKIIDLNETIANMKGMLHRLIEENITLHVFLDPELPLIKADPAQIDQIIMNLMVNARDAIHALPASDKRAKKIIIETKKEFIQEGYTKNHPGSRTGWYALFSVSDVGIGMPEDVKQKIFEPFFTTKEVSKGTGLGLSTVYGIVKQNNGFIYVYSEPGKGTTIKIYWPAAEEPMEKKEISAQNNLNDFRGNETILLVEDEESLRNLARDALIEFGYQVYTAGSGQEALDLVKTKNITPALLLTDLIMPGISGHELAILLQKLLPDIKTIFVSGYTDNHIVQNGFLEEGIHFMQKPYSITELVKYVRQILDS